MHTHTHTYTCGDAQEHKSLLVLHSHKLHCENTHLRTSAHTHLSGEANLPELTRLKGIMRLWWLHSKRPAPPWHHPWPCFDPYTLLWFIRPSPPAELFDWPNTPASDEVTCGKLMSAYLLSCIWVNWSKGARVFQHSRGFIENFKRTLKACWKTALTIHAL